MADVSRCTLSSQPCLELPGHFPALTQYAWTLHLAALPPCEAVFRLHSSQLKPSALPSRSRSVNCLHFTGRGPRQTWNKARKKEPTDRALDFSRRGATVSWAGEEYRLTHAKPSPCLSPRGKRGGEIWARNHIHVLNSLLIHGATRHGSLLSHRYLCTFS